MVLSTDLDAESRRRQRWLSLLAKSPCARVEALWAEIQRELPPASPLRRPEIGLVMVQGRISGTGAAFCAGEMTATRAAVRLDSGEVGIGYVGGRNARHAEIVAAIDALGQRAEWRALLERRIDPRDGSHRLLEAACCEATTVWLQTRDARTAKGRSGGKLGAGHVLLTATSHAASFSTVGRINTSAEMPSLL